ncbi:hypothetical protein AVEN_163696-1 [Araneus ventricosus]|uniref:Uncharacterized protein n=1 Tax=Araneus ventricosus TaxID=182803 RepID=A0A4Y2PYM0_ARAVE|nr:hypothetical protein AVEN_163696-1 [Araneus ventricosus]
MSCLPCSFTCVPASRRRWGVSPEEMIYGQCWCFPGEFFRNSKSPRPSIDRGDLSAEIALYSRKLRPVTTYHHSSSDVFLPPDLRTSTHVFVHPDTIR